MKWQFMMANYEIVQFIAINQDLIANLQFSSKSVTTDAFSKQRI